VSKLARTTISIILRERFSLAEQSLANILDRIDPDTPVLYLDGNTPAAIAERLQKRCEAYGARYLRYDRFLAPNEARALALAEVQTPYLVFIDNDVFVTRGWLTALEDCAEATGAWAATPLLLEGDAMLPLVHMAGGELIEGEREGWRTVRQTHRLMRRLPRMVRRELRREPCGFFEYHCVLLRRDCFEKGCTLDTELRALHEHIDLAMQIHRAGGRVYFEPGSVVRYDNATRFKDVDRTFFELRWSEGWTHSSIEHFRDKWQLAPDDAGLAALDHWASRHRGLLDQSHAPWLRRALPLVLRREGRGLLRRIAGRRAG
jgi:hypothetical protein